MPELFETKLELIRYVENDEPMQDVKKMDGRLLGRKTVQDDKLRGVSSIADNTITNGMMTDDSIKQAELDYEQVSVTVSAGSSSGTATVTSGSIIIGWRATGNQDQHIDNISVSGTTLTITLAANAVADCTFQVTLLKT